MAGPEERIKIDVPGRGEISSAYARPKDAFASIVVAHGAGSGMDHPFLAGFARAIAELGVAPLRFNFPYMEAGRRSTDTPAVAIEAWRAAFEAASARAGKGEPVWASGKSFGGRMASMAVADSLPAAGLVFLGYPLHAPGKPEKIRYEHLYKIGVPMLFIQGSADPFAIPAILAPVLKRLGKLATLHGIEGGGHSLELSRKDDPRQVGASMAPVAATFIEAHSPKGRS